jgi:hypothetical protein
VAKALSIRCWRVPAFFAVDGEHVLPLAAWGEPATASARRCTLPKTAWPSFRPPEFDADTFAGLPNVLPGERAVCIKPDVIVRAASEIRKRGLA